MQTWLDLEKRFRLLIPELKDTRLDEQTGDDGEYWRLAGGYTPSSRNEFELLSTLAGNLLREIGRNKAELREIINQHDSKICWYRALKKFSDAYKHKFYAVKKDKEGNDAGIIFTGSIFNVPENSANVCLYMELHYARKTRFYKKLWNEYGKQIIVGVAIAVIGAAVLAVLRLS